MKLLPNSGLLAMALLLLACEKEVTSPKLSGYKSQLVINAFISPQDTLLRVFVYGSKPVLDDQPRYDHDALTDATVTLSDGQRTILLPVTKAFPFAYQARRDELPVRAGNTYYLEVRTPDGRRAKAQCTVPVANANAEWVMDSVDVSENGFNSKLFTGSWHWQDQAGEENYYRVEAEVTLTRVNSRNEFFEQSIPLSWDGNKSTFFSDSRLDGTRFTSPETTFALNQFVTSATLYAYQLTTDRAYFEYHRTMRANETGNPFVEPVLIYSNVEGGLGVFAAFNRNIVALKLK
jgi:hypothetical protein